jgi:hypothetical protein
MARKNPFQARSPIKGLNVQGHYPEVPAGWPNRATRRAVKGNRMSRLSSEWRQVLVVRPALVDAIKGMQ